MVASVLARVPFIVDEKILSWSPCSGACYSGGDYCISQSGRFVFFDMFASGDSSGLQLNKI